MKTMPALFIGHGSPMNAIQKNSFSEFLANLGRTLPRPRAILCVSAHWETQGTQICMDPKPQTIHDFFGFPQELFNVQYPAPGSSELALLVKEIDESVILQPHYGLDHGAWSVLIHMYPHADIPVNQLSIDVTKTPAEHLKLAKKLRVLRDEGYMIIATGNIVHNLRLLDRQAAGQGAPWAQEFDEAIAQALQNRDSDTLLNYEQKLAPASKLSVPSPEHFVPLYYAYGASSEKDIITFPFTGFEMMGLSMRSVLFEKPDEMSLNLQ